MFLLASAFSSAACLSAETPRIEPVSYFNLEEDVAFRYDFNVTNMDESEISYTYALLDNKLTGINMNKKGLLSFTPSSDDVGISKIAIIAVKGLCAQTLIVTLDIYGRPDITSFEPKNSSLQINQTETVIFKVKARSLPDEKLKYEWFFDKEFVEGSTNDTAYVFKPGYDLYGIHDITVKITNSNNLSVNKTWYAQISKVNRAPVLLFPIPNFLVFQNTEAGAYDLNDYFSDPDGGILRFEYKQVKPEYEEDRVSFANVSIMIEETGFISYNPISTKRGYVYFIFTAYDIFNLSAESNIVRVDVVGNDNFGNLSSSDKSRFCGDLVCTAGEDCTNCPFDCGPCLEEHIGCMPYWNCTEWGPCLPAGFMIRNCTDENLCDDNRSIPDLAIGCEYTATCDDGLKNGIEEGVDCGEPCDPCPTCNDSIQNQGEDGVDCGGPCALCPTCIDKVQNQDESDVDCGGECEGCGGNRSCLKNMDCQSLRCDHLVCTFPSCSDTIRNQGEEGIDCGGPCEKHCGNCSDGVHNRNEDGVDCGGFCKPCPSCNDEIKNNGEWLLDCGGPCPACSFNNYFKAYSAIIIILVVVIIAIPIFFIGYFFFLLANPNKAGKLYEKNSSFTMMVSMNRFFRKFRKKRKILSEDATKGFLNELTELSHQAVLNDKVLYEHVLRIFIALLGLPEEFDANIFNMKMRASKIPLFLKILFMGFFKKAEILPMATFVADEQKQDMIIEFKFLLSELAKG